MCREVSFYISWCKHYVGEVEMMLKVKICPLSITPLFLKSWGDINPVFEFIIMYAINCLLGNLDYVYMFLHVYTVWKLLENPIAAR